MWELCDPSKRHTLLIKWHGVTSTFYLHQHHCENPSICNLCNIVMNCGTETNSDTHGLRLCCRRWEYRLLFYKHFCVGIGSVGVATELRAGRSGIESRWGRDFPPVQTGPGAHPASCTMGTGSFLGVKCGRGVLLTTHPLLVPRS